MRTTFASGLENPGALAFDAAGNLYSLERIVAKATKKKPAKLR